MDEPEPLVGVIVVRVWLEQRASPALRARLTRTTDLAAGERTVSAAAGADDICDQVRAWLNDFQSRSTRAGGRGGPQ
jgi:hypothetical protein